MKITVAHPNNQHVSLLLRFLFKYNYLDKFYTSFYIPTYFFKFIPKLFKNNAKKRTFLFLPDRFISSLPLSFIVNRIFCRNLYCSIKWTYTWFDKYVARKITNSNSDVIICYENSNYQTFKKAKKKGIITVLDLAQIHHRCILDISNSFGFLDDSYTAQAIDFMNARKEKALEFTDYIFTLSSFARDSLLHCGIAPEKIFTVNLGVNLKNFHPKTAYSAKAKFRFLFVGTITRRKGLDILFQAFKDLEFDNTELVLVGPMADGKDLLDKYKGSFTYLPFLHHEELAEQYRLADVFVFPSYLDSWAQTVIEAMACGTPAIVSENTGAKDAVVQGGGFVIAPGNVAALKEKMLYCYNNRNEVERMGIAAAQIASQYTIENYHQQVLKAIKDIALKEGLPL